VNDNSLGVALATLIFAAVGLVSAADAPACCKALSEDPDALTCPERAFALFLPRPVSPKSLLFIVDHRAQSAAFDSPLRDGLGLDNGSLKIGLELRYSPFKNLDAGLRRVNNAADPFDTYEFDARFCILEESNSGLDAAVRGGVTLFYQDTSGTASGYFGSLSAGRSIGNRIYVTAGVLYHSNSTNFSKTVADKDWTLCAPFALSIRMAGGFFVLAEGFAPLQGYNAGKPGYAYGFKYATFRHSFSAFLTNTQYSTADGVATGSDRLDKPVLGFMITRKFGGE
jgi:hypothetical protein